MLPVDHSSEVNDGLVKCLDILASVVAYLTAATRNWWKRNNWRDNYHLTCAVLEDRAIAFIIVV